MEKFLFWFKKIIPARLFAFLRPVYHFVLAFWAAFFYGFPSRKLVIIGVTGTKGKTTVVELLHKVLEGEGERVGVASLSSLRFKIGEREIRNDTTMTMPGRMFVQKFLHEAVKNKCKYAVLEVTSEGIKQFRHRFTRFSAAVMTNVAPEHLETHGSFEKYLRAKLDLFWRLSKEGLAIINRDDPQGIRFSASTAAPKIFYDKNGIELNGKILSVREVTIGPEGIEFEINGQTIYSKLLGEFNFCNILAALAFGLGQHIELGKIAQAISQVSVIPGRMEFMQREPFAVVVDYAHTPDSLKNVYTFLRTSYQLPVNVRKLICVLGAAGGGRDKWKRPELGKIAAEFCDEIILTNEDPYDENPAEILEQISAGFSQIRNSKSPPLQGEARSTKLSGEIRNYKKILDRREAIQEALKSAKSGDTIIITGKGAEPWIMGSGNTRVRWDDREVVKEELKKLKQA